MHRRRVLAATGAGALALLTGCLGPGGAGVGDPDRPSGTATPPAGGIDFSEGPKQPPERPATLDGESAARFAKTYEYRHVYNKLYVESGTVSVSCDVHEVRETAWGWAVVVSCRGATTSGGAPIPNSTATSTPLHGDYFRQYYTYLVGESGVARRKTPDRP